MLSKYEAYRIRWKSTMSLFWSESVLFLWPFYNLRWMTKSINSLYSFPVHKAARFHFSPKMCKKTHILCITVCLQALHFPVLNYVNITYCSIMLYMHRLHQSGSVWMGEADSMGMRAGPALKDEHITHIQRIFQILPLVKFSITWVNRGQWGKNKYPHLSQTLQPSPLPAHTHTHKRTHRLTLAVSPSDCLLGSLTHHDKCPFSPRTIFPAMSDMGILMNAQWQYLRSRAAILPLQIYPQVTFVRQEKETTETNRCGSETHLLSQIKNSSFKAAQRYWGWFLGLSMQMEVWLGTWGMGDAQMRLLERRTVCPSVQLPLWG